MKRFRKSAIALVLAVLMALQGTKPIFVQAKEAIEDVQKNADFSRPEALTEEEAGITDSTSGEQDKSQQSDADVQNETTPSEDTDAGRTDNSSGRNRRKSAGKRSGTKRTTGLLSDSGRTGRRTDRL